MSTSSQPEGLNKSSLPIDKYQNKILDLIKKNDVVIISSSTGSGKTTRLPQFILKDNPNKIQIAVTQPRRIAAIKAASRVAKELGGQLGELVGYKISMDSKTSADTEITFMTTYTLVEILSRSKHSVPYNYIILDEVHGRDLPTDQLLLQIKLLQQEDWEWKVKIILLSATLNMDKYIKYFNSVRVAALEIPSQERLHPIYTYFIDDIEKQTPEGVMVHGFQDYNPATSDVSEKNINYEYVKYLICQLDKMEMLSHKRQMGPNAHKADSNTSLRGAVLIFLPGIGEISYLKDKLNSYNLSFRKNWVVHEFHSSLQDKAQRKIFKSVELFERQIILATNIAESSVTIKNVNYVVDFCLTKYVHYDAYTTFSGLTTALASHHQCEQRTGRTGRMRPGYCFRLVTRDFWDTKMSIEPAAEIQNCGLGLAFLNLKNLNMGPPYELLQQAMDAPDLDHLTSSVLSLKEVGALTILRKDGSYSTVDGEITVIGELAILLSCDPRAARLIAFGWLFGLLNESIVMAMSLTSKSIFASFSERNVQKGVNAFVRKMEIGGCFKSDALLNLGAYETYLNERRKRIEGGTRNASDNHRDSYDDTPSWTQRMKENDIRTTSINDLDFAIDRAHRKLQRYLFAKSNNSNATLFSTQNRNRNLITIQDLKTDRSGELLFKIQIMLAAASYPNIFHKPIQKNQGKYIDGVRRELRGSNPKQSVYLKVKSYQERRQQQQLQQQPNGQRRDSNTFTPNPSPPNKEQLQEICTQLTMQQSLSKPFVYWVPATQFILVDYSSWQEGNRANDIDHSTHQWIGEIHKDVYRALKFKGMNHQIYWTLDNERKHKVILDGPLSPIALNFKCYYSSFYHCNNIDIDRESINQYSLDENYPEPTSYTLTSMLMCKPRIKLVAKESTIMPNIPGIFTCLHLLFAPHLQLFNSRRRREEGVRGEKRDNELNGNVTRRQQWRNGCNQNIESESLNEYYDDYYYDNGIAGLGFTPNQAEHDADGDNIDDSNHQLIQQPRREGVSTYMFQSHNSSIDFDIQVTPSLVDKANRIRDMLNELLHKDRFFQSSSNNSHIQTQRQIFTNNIMDFIETCTDNERTHYLPPCVIRSAIYTNSTNPDNQSKQGDTTSNGVFDLFPNHAIHQ